MDDRIPDTGQHEAPAQPTPVLTGVVVAPESRRLPSGRTSGNMLSVRDIRAMLDAALDELDELGDRIATATRLR